MFLDTLMQYFVIIWIVNKNKSIYVNQNKNSITRKNYETKIQNISVTQIQMIYTFKINSD